MRNSQLTSSTTSLARMTLPPALDPKTGFTSCMQLVCKPRGPRCFSDFCHLSLVLETPPATADFIPSTSSFGASTRETGPQAARRGQARGNAMPGGRGKHRGHHDHRFLVIIAQRLFFNRTRRPSLTPPICLQQHLTTQHPRSRYGGTVAIERNVTSRSESRRDSARTRLVTRAQTRQRATPRVGG